MKTSKALRGFQGAIKSENKLVGYVDTWNITANQAVVETSTLGNRSKEYLDTAFDWSGSFSGSFAPTDDGQKSFIENVIGGKTEGAFEFIFMLSSSTAYHGYAYITSINNTVAHADKVTASFNFQGTGDLEYGTVSEEGVFSSTLGA